MCAQACVDREGEDWEGNLSCRLFWGCRAIFASPCGGERLSCSRLPGRGIWLGIRAALGTTLPLQPSLGGLGTLLARPTDAIPMLRLEFTDWISSRGQFRTGELPVWWLQFLGSGGGLCPPPWALLVLPQVSVRSDQAADLACLVFTPSLFVGSFPSRLL